MLYSFQSGKKHNVLHYHYLLWPDFGVPPSPDSFLELLFTVRDGGVLNNAAHPMVVHCSAGVGRSGVFCIVDACLKMVIIFVVNIFITLLTSSFGCSFAGRGQGQWGDCEPQGHAHRDEEIQDGSHPDSRATEVCLRGLGRGAQEDEPGQGRIRE